MTDAVQPLAVSIRREASSDRQDLGKVLDKASETFESSSDGDSAGVCEGPLPIVKEEVREQGGKPDDSSGVPLQEAADNSNITPSSPSRYHEENSSGRCNPDPIRENTPLSLSLASPGQHRRTLNASAASSSRVPINIETGSRENGKPSIAGVVPAGEAVKVQVIRPHPVKTVPQAAGAPRVLTATLVAPLPVSAPLPMAQAQVHQNPPLADELDRLESKEDEDQARRRSGEIQDAQRENAPPKRTQNEEAAAAQIKEQQRQKKETKRHQAAQCNFPTCTGAERPPDTRAGGAVNAMAPADTNGQRIQVPHMQYSHGKTGNRQHAGAYDQRGQGYRQQSQARSNSASAPIGGRRKPHGRSISAGSASMDMDGGAPPPLPPTPLFERLVSDEVQEIKAYVRIIEEQNRKLAELERENDDLERRLELLTNERMQLEGTLEDRERSWSSKHDSLQNDNNNLKEVVEVEKGKNMKLVEQLVRKDQDIHRMLARKYEQQSITHSTRNYKPPTHGERSSTPPAAGVPRSSSSGMIQQHKSPHEILSASGSIEAVRERNVANSLLDFFGI